MISKAVRRLRTLGGIRDGAILLASLLYASGYLTWTIYAWRYRLGPIRALDAQYFAMGAPITVFVVIAIVAIRLCRYLAARWHRFYQSREIGVRRQIKKATDILFISSLVAGSVSAVLEHKPLMLVFGLGAFVAVVLLDFPDSDSQMEQVTTWYIMLPIAVLIIVAVAAFVLVLYPTIPQSIGGGAPRKAQIEILASEASPELLRALAPQYKLGMSIVRSKAVWIVAVPGESLLLSTTPDLQLRSDRIQIRRESVPVILWLD